MKPQFTVESNWAEGEDVVICNQGLTYVLKEAPVLTSSFTLDGKGHRGYFKHGCSFEGWLSMSADQAIELAKGLLHNALYAKQMDAMVDQMECQDLIKRVEDI